MAQRFDLDAARLTVDQQIVSVQYELIEDDLETDNLQVLELLKNGF